MYFVPYECPKSPDGSYTASQEEHRILFSRRELLGLTQQQVADAAHVQLRQIQRLEAGTSSLAALPMKTGLSICAALLLDPYEMISLQVRQPNPLSLKPTPSLDQPVENVSKRKGRKPLQRDVLPLFFNVPDYPVVIPTHVLEKLDRPDHIRLLLHPDKKLLLFHSVSADTDEAIRVPAAIYGTNAAYALPRSKEFKRFFSGLEWDKNIFEAEGRLVKDAVGTRYVYCDLKTAKPSAGPCCPLIPPFDL